jgi:ParB-like chromosome segregation protein Spo0J
VLVGNRKKALPDRTLHCGASDVVAVFDGLIRQRNLALQPHRSVRVSKRPKERIKMEVDGAALERSSRTFLPLTPPQSLETMPNGDTSQVEQELWRQINESINPPELVPLSTLVRAGSPRAAGLDEAHVQRLMEAEGPLPAIIVHRETMRIIDGSHRVAAAMAKGLDTINARLIDGSWESAFVIAVKANVTHGLPLSLADRRAAADRILQTHADWADRAIASAVGLSAKTVCAIRRSAGEDPQLHKRLGKDGRLRPVSASAGRRLAAEILVAQPRASLRKIAAEAGISPGTVRDVRDRLQRGADPVSASTCSESKQDGKGSRTRVVAEARVPADVTPVLVSLSKDPALRMNAAGRDLLRWLRGHAVNTVDSTTIIEFVPDHCVDQLVELASRCAANWAKIASDLEHLG